MSIPVGGDNQSAELRSNGRLWYPGARIPIEEGNRHPNNAPVACPNRKYVFVKPRGAYDFAEFDLTRDQFYNAGGTNNTIAGYVFWLGDSSSCGGTIIAHDRSNPAQAFLLNPSGQSAFARGRMTVGGFFLLGNQQGAGSAASEIKKITWDCDLDFLVLAAHQTGATPEFSAAALRHLIASIRWDFGYKKPILLMMGDESPSIHLMRASGLFSSNELGFQSSLDVNPTTLIVPAATRAEDNQPFPGTPLLLGDIEAQQDIAYDNPRAAELHVLDRTGYLGLNWWPIMAFVPNSSGGVDIGTSIVNMAAANRPTNSPFGRAFYHPLLIPTGGSGCPFNTIRSLSTSELNRAESLFESSAPTVIVRNRTTSAWFWDYDNVKNHDRVRSWTVPSGRLTTQSANLEYMSDVTAVWASKPRWVSHPIMGQDYAMAFYLEGRGNSDVIWDERTEEEILGGLAPGGSQTLIPQDNSFGNVPYLMGAGDITTGWLTTVTPFEVSPTALKFQFYKDDVPLIPGWVKFDWRNEVEGGVEGEHMTPRVCPKPPKGCHDWIDLANDCTDNTAKKWNGGKNQAKVVMHGKLCDSCVQEFGDSAFLALACAPFAINIQVRNINMGRTRATGDKSGLVWPSRLFYVSPIQIPGDIPGLQYWSTVPVDFGGKFSKAVGTPISIDLMQRENAQVQYGILPAAFLTIQNVLTDKGDFPPMMDGYDPDLGRGLHNHLARVDITPNRVPRAAERTGGGGGAGGGGWIGCPGVESLGWRWPVQDDKPLAITGDYTSAGLNGNDHCGLDITYGGGHNIDGEQVNAAATGVVYLAGHDVRCGYFVWIKHIVQSSGRAVYSQYCHLNGPSNRKHGDEVNAGDKIGNVGNSGYSTGPHLHFSIHCDQVGSQATCDTSGVDPCSLLPTPASGFSGGGFPCVARDANVSATICRMFDELVGDREIPCPDGVSRRIKDVALAIARCESGLDPCRFNDSCCVGLYQINQLAGHIATDTASGLISSARMSNPCTGCTGGPVADYACNLDYFTAEIAIRAAFRISSNGSNWGPWSCWVCNPPECNPTSYPFLKNLSPGCP